MTRALIERASALLRAKFEGMLNRGLTRRSHPDSDVAANTLSLEIDIVALDSHKPHKFSRHLVLQPHVVAGQPAARCTHAHGACNAGLSVSMRVCAACVHAESTTRVPLPLLGSPHAGELARRVVADLGEALVVQKENGNAGNFVDLCVYSAKRPFRLLANSKRVPAGGHAPPLVPNFDFTSPRYHELLRTPTRGADARTIAAQLRATLVAPPEPYASLLDAQRKSSLFSLLSPFDFPRRLEYPVPNHAGMRSTSMAPVLPSTARGVALLAAAAAAMTPGVSYREGSGKPISCQPVASTPTSTSRALAGGSKEEIMPASAPTSESRALVGGSREEFMPERGSVSCGMRKWHAFYSPLTNSPLLDLPPPLSDHPSICATAKGVAPLPELFHALALYAATEFGRSGGAVRNWTYIRSANPTERLLHITSSGSVPCRFIGRPHKSQRVMLSFDLIGQRVWQRCWDPECRVVVSNGQAHVKARAALDGPDILAWPSWEALGRFELAMGCIGVPDHLNRISDLSQDGTGQDLRRADLLPQPHTPEGTHHQGAFVPSRDVFSSGVRDVADAEFNFADALRSGALGTNNYCSTSNASGGEGRTVIQSALSHARHALPRASDGTHAFSPCEATSNQASTPSRPSGNGESASKERAALQGAPINCLLGVLDYAQRFAGDEALANFDADNRKRRARLARMLLDGSV